jgi:hypothetical protein
MTNTLDEAIARQLGRPLYELINKHLADGQQAEATLARVHAYAVHAIDAGDTGPGPTLGRLLLQLLDGDTAATQATEPPAQDGGPDVTEAARDDRRWPPEGAGE